MRCSAAQPPTATVDGDEVSSRWRQIASRTTGNDTPAAASSEEADGDVEQSVRELRRRLDQEGEGAQRGGLTDLRDGEERVDHAHAEETRGSADRGDQPLLGILVTLLAGFAAVEAVEEIEQLSSRVVLGEAQLTACGLSGRERSRTLLGSLTCD